MPRCVFVTDLHGHRDRYEKLFALVAVEQPSAVFLGGDLQPTGSWYAKKPEEGCGDFVREYLWPAFERLRENLGPSYPAVFLIPGNDDPSSEEPSFLEAASRGAWLYIQGRKGRLGRFQVYGYAYVPPTPFTLKDWERYDVSRFVDPGCISPEEGRRTVPFDANKVKWSTIQQDLAALANDDVLADAIFLMHAPPYATPLDRAALDGKQCDHVPLDVHVGSIAVRRFIEQRQPLLTLHGHVHESTRLTGEWKTRIGRTICINGAHDGRELAVVRFDPESPAGATRELV
ncbi:MAG TPA: metallophosphoesterase [Candidatus Binatia bacterium]|nr:metallophosphoesterase [Candidatus Binatia bacterium]